jgi:hypothetical protein
LVASPLGAQTKRAETGPTVDGRDPEAVAANALASLKENRIGDFAAAMHPEALKALRSTMLSVVDAAEAKGRTAEALATFKNVRSADELRKLDDVAFFTVFLEGMMQVQPRLRDALRGMTSDVIGHVAEGPDVVHVVYRGTVTQGDVKLTKLSVMSLKSNGDGWGMLLTGDIEGMAAALKRQFDARE